MGVGHLAAAVVLKKADSKINLGFLVFAAMFADFLLGILVLLGIEQVHIPDNFSELHYLTFTFPYSHGLAATLLWALGAYFLSRWLFKEDRLAGFVAAAAVLSHFVLDALVHIPELPLLGSGSPLLGLGLWNQPAISLSLEMGLTLAAMVIWLGFMPGLSRSTRFGVAALLGVMAILTATGQVFSTQAPPIAGAAVSWIMETVLVSGMIFWLDRKAAPGQQAKNVRVRRNEP